MHAQPPSSSETKATTATQKLLATAMIGAALIGYQVHKTPDARSRLESLASQAHLQGDISDGDAEVVAQLLAKPSMPRLTNPTFLV